MTSGFIGLYVDDIRDLPKIYGSEWTLARSFHEAICKLELIDFESIDLDHDLASFYGNIEMTGVHILLWLIERRNNGLFVPKYYYVHSANPVGAENMRRIILDNKLGILYEI